MLKSILLLVLFIQAANARLIECRVASDLFRALHQAVPGDDIVIYAGTYLGRFRARNSGTADNPITIRSANPQNKAVLDGVVRSEYDLITMHVTGNHVTVQDLIIQNGNKGVIFDNAQNSELLNCEIRSPGKSILFSIEEG